MTQLMESWSHSKLVEFEKCKRRTWLLHVARIPEPPHELRPGQTEHANDRGSRIHDLAERFVKGELKTLPVELRAFRADFERLQMLYADGNVSTEGLWGYDIDWTPMNWNGEFRVTKNIVPGAKFEKVAALPKYGRSDTVYSFEGQNWLWHPCWHRSKLDAIVHMNEYHAVVIDYKTGKKYGNEVKHGEQLQLYALDTVARFPDIEEVTAELWYLDTDEITTFKYTRAQALKFKRHFTERGMAATTCQEWPANPSIFVCRYCDYGSIGQCNVSAKDKYVKGQR